jgi:uncharacterized iron-regulated protein
MHITIAVAPALLLALCSFPTFAVDAAAPAACPQPGTWLRLASGGASEVMPARRIIAEMARRDVVLLGEDHDDADQHSWQLHTLAALHARNPRMVIGLEMFPHRAQPVLDKWVAGELTAEEFLRQSNWKEVWRFPAELYLPLFQFARIHRVPMVALNVDRELTAEIARNGWDGVREESREGVSGPATPSMSYRKYLFQVWREHESSRGDQSTEPTASSPAFRHFVEAQLTWDRSMAQGLASRLGGSAGSGRTLAVGIVGASHLRNGYGVPHQLRALGVHTVGVLLPVVANSDCADLTAGLADAVFALSETRASKPRPPRLGVRLEQSGSHVTLIDVTTGSLAERTGLERGDIIAQVAGRPLSSVVDMVEAVNRQPAGTWLPILVKRGNQSLEIVVKFPPEAAMQAPAGQ